MNSNKLTELLVKLRGVREKSSSCYVSMTLPIKEIDGVCKLNCKLTGQLYTYSEYENFAFEVATTFNNPVTLFRFEKRSNTRRKRD